MAQWHLPSLLGAPGFLLPAAPLAPCAPVSFALGGLQPHWAKATLKRANTSSKLLFTSGFTLPGSEVGTWTWLLWGTQFSLQQEAE